MQTPPLIRSGRVCLLNLHFALRVSEKLRSHVRARCSLRDSCEDGRDDRTRNSTRTNSSRVEQRVNNDSRRVRDVRKAVPDVECMHQVAPLVRFRLAHRSSRAYHSVINLDSPGISQRARSDRGRNFHTDTSDVIKAM